MTKPDTKISVPPPQTPAMEPNAALAKAYYDLLVEMAATIEDLKQRLRAAGH